MKNTHTTAAAARTYTTADAIEDLRTAQIETRKSFIRNLKKTWSEIQAAWDEVNDYRAKHPDQFINRDYPFMIMI